MSSSSVPDTGIAPYLVVLLDVDGVINDLKALRGEPRPWEISQVRSHGYVLHVPEYMPELVQHLCSIAEVVWCTTWLHRANQELRRHLAISELEVLAGRAGSPTVGWKEQAARPLVESALEQGARVYWIEDFFGELPDIPDVVYVDTAEAGVLRPEHLPDELRP